jgi:hypothetical protein
LVAKALNKAEDGMEEGSDPGASLPWKNVITI